MALANITSC